LNINIKKSFSLIAIVAGAHTGALLIVLVVPAALLAKSVMAALIVASLAWQWFAGSLAVQGNLRLDADGACLFPAGEAGNHGQRYRIVRATVSPLGLFLGLEHDTDGKRTLLVMRDAVSSQAFHVVRALVEQRRLPVRDQAV
jgi:hypothetical protein